MGFPKLLFEHFVAVRSFFYSIVYASFGVVAHDEARQRKIIWRFTLGFYSLAILLLEHPVYCLGVHFDPFPYRTGLPHLVFTHLGMYNRSDDCSFWHVFLEFLLVRQPSTPSTIQHNLCLWLYQTSELTCNDLLVYCNFSGIYYGTCNHQQTIAPAFVLQKNSFSLRNRTRHLCFSTSEIRRINAVYAVALGHHFYQSHWSNDRKMAKGIVAFCTAFWKHCRFCFSVIVLGHRPNRRHRPSLE